MSDQLASNSDLPKLMYNWAKGLFPICRSLTGPGVRQTLDYLQQLLPDMLIHSVKSGTVAFDWVVPDEWTIRDAYVADENGNRVIDFKRHNLHVVGYSEPVDCWMTLEELDPHLHSLPDKPEAIPYVTSFYRRTWGFCLTHKTRVGLTPGRYRVVIDSDLKPGELNYGELILPGQETSEVLLSTYICHPSMANNELSGPVVTTAICQWLKSLSDRRYTYRIVFIPETIGSILYLSLHHETMKMNTIAGFVITCVGDERTYSFLPSRKGNTLADSVAKHVLTHLKPDYCKYSFLERGSDERQYCAPGIDLPVVSIMRSKYDEYPEYHTSLDDLSLVTPEGLFGGFTAHRRAIEAIEYNCRPLVTVLCEPQLGKRGLYPSISTASTFDAVFSMINLIAYSDGTNSLLEIAEIIGVPIWELVHIFNTLNAHGLVVDLDASSTL